MLLPDVKASDTTRRVGGWRRANKDSYQQAPEATVGMGREHRPLAITFEMKSPA